jgi:RNA-directed DNA polymerase
VVIFTRDSEPDSVDALRRITEWAQEDSERKFYSIAHLLTPEALHEAFSRLRKNASAGVDKVTYKDYQRQVQANIQGLHDRLKTGTYEPQPLRRIYVEKEDGRQRPISIPCLEDKIVQKAAVKLLNAIYETDFLPCSYGSRTGRNPHHALDEVDRILFRRPISWILEIDITSYFDSIVRKLLMEMIERRVSDSSMLELLRKWIPVGAIDEGRLLESTTGTGQGQVISPFLANVYLHHTLDRWFEDEVKPRLKGEAYEVRYVDDAVFCFGSHEDAQKFLKVLHKRFEKFGLTLHPTKTRLVEFGRSALAKAEKMQTKPATFDFLGYTHIAARSRRGNFMVKVKTMRKRLRRSLKAIGLWCKENRHLPVKEQQDTLNAKLRGHYQYYGRSSNYRALLQFNRVVERIWKMWLNRRTRGTTLPWDKFKCLLQRHPLALPRITHTWAGLRSPK